jgi:hypothetical protein
MYRPKFCFKPRRMLNILQRFDKWRTFLFHRPVVSECHIYTLQLQIFGYENVILDFIFSSVHKKKVWTLKL